ncbi:MAG: hypothetical protein PHU44_01805 [Syntrophales bacterium]|nr:hypothetical protein [Syntrophales bacterium]
MVDKSIYNYWLWFIKGSGGNPGYWRIINRWIIFHIFVGFCLTYLVKIDLTSCANTVILPLAAIFVGLSFAWVGNAQALLQSERMEPIYKRKKGGFIEYLYTFQTAILVLLTSLVLWGLAGLQVFDKTWPTTANQDSYNLIKFLLFANSSIALRECWHVVLAVQWMLITQDELKKHNKN